MMIYLSKAEMLEQMTAVANRIGVSLKDIHPVRLNQTYVMLIACKWEEDFRDLHYHIRCSLVQGLKDSRDSKWLAMLPLHEAQNEILKNQLLK